MASLVVQAVRAGAPSVNQQPCHGLHAICATASKVCIGLRTRIAGYARKAQCGQTDCDSPYGV